ncbi:hypothetical protein BJY01DRAFT_220170 [Aspergillus pseudoustus]|uniref:Uncharacterized protein n=1 Tax=Aspergillus pseudoustus TaxID=1810923 RepID=A0ABR4JES9_9EURO
MFVRDESKRWNVGYRSNLLLSTAASVFSAASSTDDGDGIEGGGRREPVYVYVMNRIRGISYLDFILRSCT